MTRLSRTAILDAGLAAGLPEYLADEISATLAAPGEFADERAVEFAIDRAIREMREF